MTITKKITAFLAAAVTALTLTACSNSEPSSQSVYSPSLIQSSLTTENESTSSDGSVSSSSLTDSTSTETTGSSSTTKNESTSSDGSANSSSSTESTSTETPGSGSTTENESTNSDGSANSSSSTESTSAETPESSSTAQENSSDPVSESESESESSISEPEEGSTISEQLPDPTPSESDKVLVAYFSWSGTSESIANNIISNTGADSYRIERETPYSDDYSTVAYGEAKDEADSNARPPLKNAIDSIDQYDTIVLCYPIWWHTCPMTVGTFLNKFDFTGKTVIPVSQSASMDVGQYEQSVAFIRDNAQNANVPDGIFSKDQLTIDSYLAQNGVE